MLKQYGHFPGALKPFSLALVLFLSLTSGLILADQRKLVILHTNDFHGHISQEGEYAGAARITALVKQTREKNPGVLVLDAGDRISGTPVSTMFNGVPIFEVLNNVGYDAAAVGNHEFDHGYKQFLEFKKIANHPLLSANAFAPDGSLLADAPALIKTVNGIKIGIIGLITEHTPDMIIPAGNEGISFSPASDALKGMVKALRPEVDLLVVLSHVGHDEEKELAQSIDGIDIIVGGHSHTKVAPPVKINNTYVVQAGYYGAYVGKLELTVDTDLDSMSSFSGELIPAADLPAPDKKVARLVKRWEKKVARLVDFKIATATRDYTKKEMQPFLELILAQAAGADFGFYNMGGIRDNFRKGPVSARHIWNIAPFGNAMVTVTGKGSAIKQMLLREDSKHHRVPNIDDDKEYTVATSNYVAAQTQKLLGDQIKLTNKIVLVRDVLIDYVKTNGLEL
ncbi:MAG: 2',3'-cyclic-nucleotide 2'-phosphodiesterase (5'-nucleotidase family) [Candidatus Azotimanducaceae bacterium]|jgi:2',3'-cyclic-nucleotide 2'-phosphodiesterase (5'-nucleotidase family)